jgi:hypothetical protein
MNDYPPLHLPGLSQFQRAVMAEPAQAAQVNVLILRPCPLLYEHQRGKFIPQEVEK